VRDYPDSPLSNYVVSTPRPASDEGPTTNDVF